MLEFDGHVHGNEGDVGRCGQGNGRKTEDSSNARRNEVGGDLLGGCGWHGQDGQLDSLPPYRLGQFVNGLGATEAQRLESAYQDKVRSIALPVLVIHGELDDLAPVQQAVSMYHDFPSQDKRLLTIPGAGHNDLLHRGIHQYFDAITGFIAPPTRI